MKHPPIVLLLLTLACSTPAAIVPPGDLVRSALAHSPLLKGQGEAVQSARARIEQADAGLLPQVDARAQAHHFDGLENQALGPVTLPVIDNQFSASVGITQPLYTGGRASAQKAGARLGEAAARHAFAAAASDVALQTLATYWQWSKARAQSQALLDSVARMERLATDTRNMAQAGTATDNDRITVEVQLDQTRLQQSTAARNAESCRIELARLTGLLLRDDQEPLPPVPGPADLAPPTEADAGAKAASNREDLTAARLTAETATALIDAARAEQRPQVALVTRYEQGRPNPRDFPPDEHWRDDAFIGATASWTLSDGGLARGHLMEALARAAQADQQRLALAEAVTAQVRQALLAWRHALACRDTATHAEAGARRNLEVATVQWKQGTARHSDVLEAQSRLTLATAQRIAAEADILLARSTLDHATGTLVTP